MKQILSVFKYIFANNPIHTIPKRIFDSVLFQVCKRVKREIYSKSLFNGKKIFIFPESAISSGFIYTPYPDKLEIDTLRKIADDNTVFLDIGANLGAYSILLLDKVREVYAFEAHPSTANYCKMNFLLNNLNPAHVMSKAIGASNEVRYFSNKSQGSPINAFVQHQENAIQVQTITLDQFVQSHQFHKNANFIVKVDVEGFEHEVLTGGQEFLKSYPIRAILFETFSERFDEIKALLTQLGFKIEKIANHNVIAIKNTSKDNLICDHNHLIHST